jgi:Super-infection exclusion protein B
MGANPKWLEILKASGWQTAALTIASALTLYLNARKQFPVSLNPWMVQAAEVAVLVFGCLTLFSVGPFIIKKSGDGWSLLAHRQAIRRAQHQVAKGIPSMTAKEREIIGYLLANNRTMFPCTADGGYANTLISKRIVVCASLPGQYTTTFGVPFKVPEHVWDVLVKHKAEFPNTWKDGEPFPWSVPFMAR